MNYSTTNRPQIFSFTKRIVLLVASSLSLGMFTPLVLPALAQTTPAPAQTTPAPAATNEVKDVNQRLFGQWLAKDKDGSPLLMFLFTPEGKLYIMPPPTPDQKARALEMGYKINSTPKPMHLDVQLDATQTVFTVFDFTSEGKMRLQLEGTNPGLARPKALADNATMFDKVSDTTTLPAGTEIMTSK